MRLGHVSTVAAAAALFISSSMGIAVVQGQQDPDKKVAGGGITAKGWQGRVDTPNKQGLTIKDSRFAPEGGGFHLTTGPAGLYWNTEHKAQGDFTVRATFREPKQTYNHPHPFGVFIGGSGLDTDKPSALYCVAYRNGNYLVRMFSGGSTVQVSGKPAPHDAVRKAEAEAEVTQEVGWNVKGDRVECVINGTAVWSANKSEVTGEGKLQSTDGLTGIRTSHNSDVFITNFALNK
ncbi:MAG: hypothetical protein H0U94_04010 [Acidobacteria bacterium]|nr:hypothetical protein [Acidobacteriota bacterium]